MLRLLVLLLVLGNAGYFAWTRGLLAPYGFAPAVQSEPQRLAQQIRPESLRILSPLEARRLEGAPAVAATVPAASSSVPGGSTSTDATPTATAGTTSSLAASSATQCLQAGLFNEEQTAVLRTRLQNTLPAGSWVLESSVEPARWMVYMGKYNSVDAVSKKKSELRQLGVAFDTLNNASLEPGLSLGIFTSQPEADAELVRIAKRGVRTAKVIQAQAELRGQKVRFAAVDASLKVQLENIKSQLGGKTLLACK
ncbi:MAG: SPOR domain-containing protein [Polaromonas sp.]|nr:SPOR domain-containing protein [Polaromonas sp.]